MLKPNHFVVIDDDTLERRRENYSSRSLTPTEVFSQHARLVSSASLGAVTDELTKVATIALPLQETTFD